VADDRTIDRLKPQGARDVRQVKWPGGTDEVGVMMLMCEDFQDSLVAARDRLRKRSQDLGLLFNAEMLQDEEQVQACYLMLLEPKATSPEGRLFKSANEVRSRVTPEERAYFTRWHVYFQEKLEEGFEFPPDEGLELPPDEG